MALVDKILWTVVLLWGYAPKPLRIRWHWAKVRLRMRFGRWKRIEIDPTHVEYVRRWWGVPSWE